MFRLIVPFAIAALVVASAAEAHAQVRPTWLTGCWALRDGGRVVEENWTSAEDEVMLGVSRTIKDGRMSEYEFVVLRQNGQNLEYGVRLGERPEVVFTAATSTANEVVFQNLEHPFPKRIGYKLVTPDSLSAWIDGGAGSKAPRVAYPYHRITCGRPPSAKSATQP